MSPEVIRGVIKVFWGQDFVQRGSTLQPTPLNRAQTVAPPWEWGTMGMADPEDGGPKPILSTTALYNRVMVRVGISVLNECLNLL